MTTLNKIKTTTTKIIKNTHNNKFIREEKNTREQKIKEKSTNKTKKPKTNLKLQQVSVFVCVFVCVWPPKHSQEKNKINREIEEKTSYKHFV